DEAFLNSLTAELHAAMQQYIFPAQAPAGWHTGNAARLIALTNADVIPTPQLVDEKGFTVTRSNIVSFTKARTDFRASFAPEDHLWANFAVQFLKENCAPDMKLTEAVRDSRTATIQMGDTYQAGQVVAKRGDIVTVKSLAAIERVGDLRASQIVQKPQEVAVKPAPVPVVAVESNNNWLWFALGAVSLTAVAAIWKLKRRPVTSLVPSRFGSGDNTETTVVGSGDFREMLAPHLARLMTNKLVRKLVAQRSDLIAMQQQVTSEIEELERRLEQVHAPLQERLLTYEKRIAELEHQLAEQAEQNRELIKAKIEAVKQQMESERAKNRLKFN
ncbi:MAG TPA: hypothetical protein VH255_10855, partial [Verrucomicrobiae bacterium]|nr:hypothetical protein [Verrucomicrobiae bacterium]